MTHESTLRASSLFHGIDATTADSLLKRADVCCLEQDDLLFQEGSNADFMGIVLEGTLEVVVASPQADRRLGIVGPGDPVGEMALLLGGTRSATVRALEPVVLARFDRTQVGAIVESSPALRAALEAVIHQRLERNRITQAVQGLFGALEPDVLRYVVDQLDPVVVERNEYLFRKGDPGDALYLVVSGSLEVLAEDSDGTERVIAHVRRGEPIGEMALLAGDRRGASIRAGRRSELVALSRTAFERLSLQYPRVLMGITRILVARFRAVSGQTSAAARLCRGYAVFAAGNGLCDVTSVVRTIVASMPDTVRATVLSPTLARQSVSSSGTDAASAALESWIDEVESRHDVVFFLPRDSERGDADLDAAAWQSLCLRRCDELLLCAHSGSDGALNEVEQHILQSDGVDAPSLRRLLIMHDSEVDVPRFTLKFLTGRDVTKHYHARTGSASDMARVARLLTGKAVGLAFGGGGAKGIAHVGVVRALTERGIPIDTVAGTSMGAIIAALYGAGYTPEQMIAQIVKMFVDLNPFNEYTLPLFSLLGGKKPELASLQTFGRFQIEDLWTPFVCTSSNISRQTLAVHRSGSLSKAILATTALPGITVPIIYDGEIHVDGGVINNLPGDLIREESAYLITCDVNTSQYTTLQSKRYPSPWRSLLQRKRREQPAPAPRIGTILNAAMSAGSMHAAAHVREISDLALTPPVADVGILDFRRAVEIERRGYEYTLSILDGLEDTAGGAPPASSTV